MNPSFDVTSTPLEPGVTLLEASAGTGKTYSLTAVVLRLLLEEKVERLDQVLLVTFTRAAAAELKQRLRRALVDSLEVLRGADPGGDPLLEWVGVRRGDRAQRVVRLALLQFDRARVTTIHAFCAQLLRESAFEAGFVFGSEESEDCSELERHALEDQWRERMYGGEPWWPVLSVVEGWKRESFLDDLREASRRSRATLLPAGPRLEDVDDAIARALETVAARWNRDEAKSRLGSVKYNRSGGAVGEERWLAWVDECGDRPDPRDARVLEVWMRLRPSILNQSLNKRGKAWKEIWDHPLFEAFDALDRATAEAAHALRLDLIEGAGERFARAKRASNRLDFDDLIDGVREALLDPVRGPRLRRRARSMVRVALIDEFQDTDLSQWEIFRTLFADSMLLLVGDPKQAIYGFRGADIFAYLQAMEEADRQYTLRRNYRSHPGLVEGVNALFGHGEDPFVFRGIRFESVEAAKSREAMQLEGDGRAPLLVDLMRDEGGKRLSRQAGEAWVLGRMADEIEALLDAQLALDDDALHAGHLAVLVRTNLQGQAVVEALRVRGRSAVLAKMGDVHRTESMRELLLVLDAVLDPRDLRRQRRAAATWLWGNSAAEVLGLQGDERAAESIVGQLEELRRTWHRRDFVAMAQDLLEMREVVVRWTAHEQGDRLLTDLRHSIEILHAGAQERGLGPEALVDWGWRETRRDHFGQDDRQLRLEADRQAVQVVTMHACKGLEYEVVFVPFAWWAPTPKGERALHYHAEDGREHLDWSPSPPQRDRHEAERMAEDMRLLYVALTRAKRRCVLFQVDAGTKSAGSERAATSFLLHRPARGSRDDGNWVRDAIATMLETRERWPEELAARLDGQKALGTLDGAPTARAPLAAPIADEVERGARAFPEARRENLRPWRLASFTGLARRLAHDTGPASESPLADRLDPAAAALGARARSDGIFAFARGARAGNCLHEVLERVEFESDPVDEDARRDEIRRVLARHGLDRVAAHEGNIDPVATVASLVETVAAERFAGEDFRFGDLRSSRCRREWAFRARMGTIDPPALAAVFERHSRSETVARTAERLRSLWPQRLRGFLGGFVDLVFTHEDRWFVVDWKSNHLGSSLDDYAPEPVAAAMLEHHYVLQYHLYVLALHRFLRLRQPDYDYERHFGAVGYVFLRGLAGREDRGWFCDRPPRALVEALDRFLDGEFGA